MNANAEIASTLEELADLLQARGELIFKIRAYRKAAAALRELPVPVEQYRREHDLKAIPGVGEAIARKVIDMLAMGPQPWLAAYRAKLEAADEGAQVPGSVSNGQAHRHR